MTPPARPAPAAAAIAGIPTLPAAGGAIAATLRNAGFLLAAYILPRVMTFAAVAIAARVAAPAEFGAYGSAAALAVILSIAGTVGMMPLLIREIARAPERAPSLMRSAHVIKLGTTLLMVALLVVVAPRTLDSGTALTAAVLLVAGYALGAFAENLGAYFHALEQMHVWMQANALFGLVSGVLGIIVVVTTRRIDLFCGAMVLGHAAALLLLSARAPAAVRLGTRMRAEDVRQMLSDVAPFTLAVLALTLYYKIDVLLLARLRAPGDVGIYTAAYKVLDIVHAIAIVAVSAVYPRLSRAGDGAGSRAGARLLELVIAATIPAAALLWILRVDFVRIVFGDAYADAAAVLALLCWVVPALALNVAAYFLLAAARRMRAAALCFGLGLACNVALNLVLIPSFAAGGAAAARVISEILLVLMLGLLMVRAGTRPRVRGVAPAVLAGLACVIAALLWTETRAALLAYAYVACILLLYWRTGVLSRTEWRTIRQLVTPGRARS